MEGRNASGVTRGQREAGRRAKVAFLCTGQGSQYVGMGEELYRTQPAFRRTLERCDEILRGELERPLRAVLYPAGEEERREAERLLHQTAYTQPALFAVEYALAELWQTWGIEPAAVLGHSVGEYVAACVAGVFTLEEGLRLVAARGRLMQGLPAGGAMAAVWAEEAQVREAIRVRGAEVSIAAINGPQSVVISGAAAAVEAIGQGLEARGVRWQKLVVSHAFHSPLMEPMLEPFERVAESVAYGRPRVRLISNLTGDRVSEEVQQAAYWRRHVREPVQFAASVQGLAAQGFELFVEIGPHPTLLGLAAQCVPAGAQAWLPSLRRGSGDWQTLLSSLGELYTRGAAVDWAGFDREYARRKVALPTYPFQRKRYWLPEKPATGLQRGAGTGAGLVGTPVRSPLFQHGEVVCQSPVSVEALPWLKDHVVYGQVVFPAAGYLELVLAAARTAWGPGWDTLERVTIDEALVLAETDARTVQVILTAPGEGRATFQVVSQAAPEGRWTTHAGGQVRCDPGRAEAEGPSLAAQRARCARELAVGDYYAQLGEYGLQYGPSFQGIAQLWQGVGEAVGRLDLPEGLAAEAGAYGLHPALVDAGFQMLGAAVTSHTGDDEVFLPVGIERLRWRGPLGPRVWSTVGVQRGAETNGEILTGELRWFDETGQVVLEVDGLLTRRASRGALAGQRLQEWAYELTWQPRALPPCTEAAPAAGPWLIFADRRGVGAELVQRLEAQGARCVVVEPGETFTAPAADRYGLDPRSRADCARVVTEVVAGAPALRGVVHLWSLESETVEEVTADSLLASQAISCGSLLHLVQALTEAGRRDVGRLWVVTRGAQAVGPTPPPPQVAQTPVWGLARVIALEHPTLRCARVDVDPGADSPVEAVLAEILADDREDQVAYRGAARYVARLGRLRHAAPPREPPLAVPRGEAYGLAIRQRGALDQLAFQPVARRAPGPGEVEIEVEVTGLNFRDVLNVLGMYRGEAGPLGGEYSGRVVAVGEGVDTLQGGEAVLGMAGGSFGQYVTVPAELVVRRPEQISGEQAATLPIAFLTAFYGLEQVAGMKRGDRVLIHAAAGGVGLAAVQLAQRAGAEVFGTAGSPEKRAFLTALGVPHVMSSRTLDFAEQIRALTGGRGVDIVLNALTGDFIPQSLSVLAPGGRFLEIGKAEIWTAAQVAAVNPAVRYTAFDLADLAQRDRGAVGRWLRELCERVTEGSLQPLPLRVFPLEGVVEAFRFMAQAKHIGKIVVAHRAGAAAGADERVRPDGAYLITGGLGALGQQVARWLTARGARHVTLVSRSAPSGEALETIHAIEAAGAHVSIVQGDVANADDVRQMVAQIARGPVPLRGIVHAAGVLDDRALGHLTWDTFARVLAPKVAGAWNLGLCTQQAPLDFFVLFSSVASLLGSPGQGNYAAANAFLDGFAHYRRARGLPALSLNWGPWATVGMAASLSSRDQLRMSEHGVAMIPTADGLRLLGRLMQQNPVQVAAMPMRWSTVLQPFAVGEEPPLFESIAKEVRPQRPSERLSSGVEFRQRLADAPPSEVNEIVVALVCSQIAKILGLDSSESLEPQTSLADLGLDSLMAVELRNVLGLVAGRTLPTSLIYDHPTIERLSDYLCHDVFGIEQARRSAEPVGQEAESLVSVSKELDDLSQDEIAERLAEKLVSLTESAR